jgi:neutral ceramidase
MGVAACAFEGQQVTGYRHRLYARALLVEDARGERLALLVVDLPLVSPLLHRLTADLTRAGASGIGADRLLLSATHTHAAPGNFFEVKQYNENAGAVTGYDQPWVDFLVERFAQAVDSAYADLQPARAAWGAARIEGVTRNRSLDAFALNPEPRPGVVDDTLRLLRIDQCLPAAGGREPHCRPRGAWSVFAIHGTGNPAVNDLMDGDIHALVQRGLERHIDVLNDPARPDGFELSGVHLFANGASGDVSPAYDPGSRCQAFQKYLPGSRPAGPRTPPPPEEWHIPKDAIESCIEKGRESTEQIGGEIAEAATRLFDRLGDNRSGDFPIERSFTTLHLKHLEGPYALCDQPLTGTANWGGSEDSRTRLNGWKFLWTIDSGIEEGGAAINTRLAPCHGVKKIGMGWLQGVFVGEHGLPEYAQLTVARLGETLMAATPWELTTAVAARLKQALRAAGPDDIRGIAIVGLTNGYIQYAVTPEEYQAQNYEGGSTLYGPNTAPMIQDQLARLAASLRTGSPTANVGELLAYPGARRSYLRSRDAGPTPETITRRVESLVCTAGGLSATWLDLYPGRLVPADGQLLEIRVDGRPVAWDDHTRVEVRAKRSRGARGYLWEVRWTPDDRPGVGPELVLLSRPGLPEIRATCDGAHQ